MVVSYINNEDACKLINALYRLNIISFACLLLESSICVRSVIYIERTYIIYIIIIVTPLRPSYHHCQSRCHTNSVSPHLTTTGIIRNMISSTFGLDLSPSFINNIGLLTITSLITHTFLLISRCLLWCITCFRVNHYVRACY